MMRQRQTVRLWQDRSFKGRQFNIGLLKLPPYSPELNPVENIWEYLRQNYLSDRTFATYETIVDACCDAWNKLIAAPERIRSIATREYAKMVSS